MKREIDINQVSSEAFMPAIKKREIVRVKCVRRRERDKYNPNCLLVQEMGGEVKQIQKEECAREYRTPRMNKIKIHSISSKRPFIAMRTVNERCYVLAVPQGYKITLGGRQVQGSGKVGGRKLIVCKDKDGEMTIEGALVVPASIFRKAYFMPMNKVIHNYAHGIRSNRGSLGRAEASGIATKVCETAATKVSNVMQGKENSQDAFHALSSTFK